MITLKFGVFETELAVLPCLNGLSDVIAIYLVPPIVGTSFDMDSEVLAQIW